MNHHSPHPAPPFPLILVLAMLFPFLSQSQDKIDFNYQVRPILSDRCFLCHGPDEKARKAKLRLDTEEGIFSTLKDGGKIIERGNSSHSELYQRITSSDPDEKMPPAKSQLALSAPEIAILRQWIDQGAEWQKHWAFNPVRKTRVPESSKETGNAIDHFIQAKLKALELQPTEEATRERLIRRLTYDLTGLPPSIEQVDDFLNDTSSKAYEKIVDRLLASSHYGERFATDWLDVARYADTHGYQADRYRPVWPWRDWVVKAFNDNLPYDQFVTWQLAGDLIPQATQDQRLATTFNRLHMQTEEGGSVEEEFRVSYAVDRVNTMGTAFMGLTFECSRCHDHKYDPIKQKEFYQLFAFFNNIDESGQTSFFTDATPVPTLLLADRLTEQKANLLALAIKESELDLKNLAKAQENLFKKWKATNPSVELTNGLVIDLSFEEVTNNLALNGVARTNWARLSESPQVAAGVSGKGLILNGENGVDIKGLASYSRFNPFSFSVWIKLENSPERAVVFHHTMASLDAGSRGYELVIEKGMLTFGLTHMWPYDSLKIADSVPLPTNEWIHVAVTYDGSSSAKGLKIFRDGDLCKLVTIRDHLFKDITYGQSVDLVIGHRFRDNGFKNGTVDEFKGYNREITPLEIRYLALKPGDKMKRLSPENAAWRDYYLSVINDDYRKALQSLESKRKELNDLVNPVSEIMVMEEMKGRRPTHVLKRGAYDAPGEEVSRGTPAFLAKFAPEFSDDRLGLARWLVAKENPLTSRVTVNRYWQMFFGKGLVESSDNFGSQGTLPSHPELLDYLASDFMESGWNLKRLVRLIVTSRAYRQSSKASERSLTLDPENKFLSRGPQKRLTAEMIRDQGLAASGLLVDKLGGPPVKPYQPAGLWEEKANIKYDQDKGEGEHRRTLYSFWKRTVPHPMMITFDASERNYCLVKRQTTSTPLQALALLNDPSLLECGEQIARKASARPSESIEERLEWQYRTLATRKPSKQELNVLTQLWHEQRDFYNSHPDEMKHLLKSKLPDDLNTAAEIAAFTQVSNALFSFDEVVMTR
ncbi:MAG: Protein of unknown function (DUF1553)/Protein of unknown function (DUF1549)/Planctomycete [Verrucomicrobiales bacterium]|nr:Protein of unknown function (DUF1553)/Protein of unknown function (DUF1549)/Planctomycete [Verrucomicrobiales bacterium]